jgi:hypothetical protein
MLSKHRTTLRQKMDPAGLLLSKTNAGQIAPARVNLVCQGDG